MLRTRSPLPAALLLGLALGCGSSSTAAPDAAVHTSDAGKPHPDAGRVDSGHDATSPRDARDKDARPADANPADAHYERPDASPHPSSAIEHLVLIVQENHTFDNYFGLYCTATTGSNPSCTTGPACCETAPATDPSGATPVVLDDSTNGSWDPNHTQACEESEIDDGLMDKYVTGSSCSGAGNLAYASSSAVSTYWTLAGAGAMADRYFQSVAGASSANDMYLAGADFVFPDDDFEPQSKGAACQGGPVKSYTVPTIADLLLASGATFGVYAGGYAAAVAANPACAPVPAACPLKLPIYPCTYDPGDVPFEYYPSLRDNPLYMKDFTQLSTDLSGGNLPSFSFVKSIGYLSEHPGVGDTISGGEAFVQSVIDSVQSSPYAASTLILVTWDESGGYFDHIAPPPDSSVDNQPYGPRVPMLAIGPFALKNHVSHVQMEHSSVVKFLEWNWLGKQTGQLGTRDAVVNNLGSLLDPTTTGTTVPD
jgi:phospholipase C